MIKPFAWYPVLNHPERQRERKRERELCVRFPLSINDHHVLYTLSRPTLVFRKTFQIVEGFQVDMAFNIGKRAATKFHKLSLTLFERLYEYVCVCVCYILDRSALSARLPRCILHVMSFAKETSTLAREMFAQLYEANFFLLLRQTDSTHRYIMACTKYKDIYFRKIALFMSLVADCIFIIFSLYTCQR